jgi:hypothetical protein
LKKQEQQQSSAFSNGTEFEVWQANWCNRCTKDDVGYAPEGVFCPILGSAICTNEVPPEWFPGSDDYRDRYHCIGFENGEEDNGTGRHVIYRQPNDHVEPC